MKYSSLALSVVLLIASCSSSSGQKASSIGIMPLKDYFVKNTVSLPDSINYMVFTGKALFDSTFGLAPIDGKPVAPDFTTQQVIAIALPVSQQNADIGFEKATIQGNKLNIYYKVIRGEKLAFNVLPSAAATVPKSSDVKSVNFYEGQRKMKTIGL